MKKQIFGTIALLALAMGVSAQTTGTPTGGPVTSQQQVYINDIDFAVGVDLTANVGPEGVTIPVAVRLSTGQQIFNLRGLPLTYMLSSPTLKSTDYGMSMDAQGSSLRVFSNFPGSVVLTIVAPTTALGSPGLMYTQVVVNFSSLLQAFQELPLLVVASTAKATVGQTANLTVVIPPGNYPAGDYYLVGFDGKGNQTSNIPLGQTIQPGQAIPLTGHQVLPFDEGGWLYGNFQLVDYKRSGFTIGAGAGYTNIKYSGFRNLDARIDDSGNINLDMNSGNLGDYYRAFLVTTDGFAVELPIAPPLPKSNSGVRLTYYKGSMANAPLFTAGDYTPVVVQYLGGITGSVLVHSLPNAIHLEGDSIPFPNVPVSSQTPMMSMRTLHSRR
jgi:hypothetical protein